MTGCIIQKVLNARPSPKVKNWYYEYIAPNGNCDHTFDCTSISLEDSDYICCDDCRAELLRNEINITDCYCFICDCSRLYATIELGRITLERNVLLQIEDSLMSVANEMHF